MSEKAMATFLVYYNEFVKQKYCKEITFLLNSERSLKTMAKFLTYYTDFVKLNNVQ